jgi:superfamily II DNA/RNA helicase
MLHGGLSKLERSNVMAAFCRGGMFRAMVVTDMASRGLDIPNLDAVINMGLPEDALRYAHR